MHDNRFPCVTNIAALLLLDADYHSDADVPTPDAYAVLIEELEGQSEAMALDEDENGFPPIAYGEMYDVAPSSSSLSVKFRRRNPVPIASPPRLHTI